MSHSKYRFAFIGAILSLLVPSLRVEAKRPALKNTQWICINKVLVLDAGTMTETYTLDFISAKECIYTYKWSLPSHPAPYIGADGKVATIPGSSSESTFRGTWRLRGKTLTLKMEDGTTQTYVYEDGRLVDPVPSTSQLVFEQVKSDQVNVKK